MKFPLLIAVLVATVPTLAARLTAERALLTAPPQVIAPLLPETAHDLLDYARDGRLNRSLPSAFGAKSSILAIDSLQVALQLDSAQTLTLTLLPLKGDTIIAAISTLSVAASTADSRMTLYSSRWEPLSGLWKEPDFKLWLNDEGIKNRQKAEDSVPFIMAEYALDPTSGILTIYNRSENQQYLKPFLRYKWNGKAFKPLTK